MRYPEDFINKLIHGDCLEVMKDFPDNCIDTIITDPPYGLKFMGQKWDYDVPSIETWQECLRILKPGGTALIFAGSRTQHRMAVNVEDAGFILKDCIMWLYGSGFPKATDISQMLDKDKCRKKLEEKLGRKPTREEFKKEWEGFRKVIDYQEPFGRENRKSAGYSSEAVFGKEVIGIKGGKQPIKESATPEATLWNGWKSHGLKPAYEPILVAMKPNEGSYANNALKWKVTGLNIDGGRIPYENNNDFKDGHHNKQLSDNVKYKKTCFGSTFGYGLLNSNINKGRFPANVIHDGSDEVVGLFPNTGTSYRPNSRRGKIKSEIYMNGIVRDGYPTAIGVNDSGSASRFFYCAKASKAERNRGCERLEEVEIKGDISLRQKGVHGQTGKPNKSLKSKNHHPTVKPLALMKYLCTLTKTPTGGVVLDPFCGSGTTLMACKETSRKYIGIEIEKEYVEIAKCRLRAIEAVLF